MTEQTREERERLKKTHSACFNDLSRLMFKHDPIGLNFVDNADEYEPEVGTVLLRLQNCASVHDVVIVLHEEFCRWFGPETAGTLERYEKLATAIWSAESVQTHIRRQSAA